MNERVFADGSFTAPRERRKRLTSALLDQVPADSDIRVLDLGCGNGLQLLDLADALPRAHLTGIDTSSANIASARRRVADSPHSQRMVLLEGDYLTMNADPFDVILTDSVLQNIPVPDGQLYPKLADDIRTGGLLVVSIPYDCSYNRMLWRGRRGLRVFQGPMMERLALTAARILHPTWDRALLEERIPYLYMTPARIDDDTFVNVLAEHHGLARIAVLPVSHSSLAQAKHRLSVFRKAAAK